MTSTPLRAKSPRRSTAEARSTRPASPERDDFIRIYDDALSPRDCWEIIDRFEADDSNRYAGTVSAAPGDSVRPGLKQTAEILTQSPGWARVDQLLYENLRVHLEHYLAELGPSCRLPGRCLSDQPYRIKRYAIGDGFDWHIDNGTRETANRIIAAQWYLNDVEDGGETEFLVSGRRISCVEGRLAFFPVQWTLVHRGRPPRSSAKYIATTFFEPHFGSPEPRAQSPC